MWVHQSWHSDLFYETDLLQIVLKYFNPENQPLSLLPIEPHYSCKTQTSGIAESKNSHERGKMSQKY